MQSKAQEDSIENFFTNYFYAKDYGPPQEDSKKLSSTLQEEESITIRQETQKSEFSSEHQFCISRKTSADLIKMFEQIQDDQLQIIISSIDSMNKFKPIFSFKLTYTDYKIVMHKTHTKRELRRKLNNNEFDTTYFYVNYSQSIIGTQSRQLHYLMNRRLPTMQKQETIIPHRLNNYVKPITPKKRQVVYQNLSMDNYNHKQKRRYPKEASHMFGAKIATLDVRISMLPYSPAPQIRTDSNSYIRLQQNRIRSYSQNKQYDEQTMFRAKNNQSIQHNESVDLAYQNSAQTQMINMQKEFRTEQTSMHVKPENIVLNKPQKVQLEQPPSQQFTFNQVSPKLTIKQYDPTVKLLPTLKIHMSRRFTPTFMSYANADH